MSRFRIGEEVRYDGEIYTVSAVSEGPLGRYRLLATRPGGTRFAWAQEDEVEEISRYLQPSDDTSDY